MIKAHYDFVKPGLNWMPESPEKFKAVPVQDYINKLREMDPKIGNITIMNALNYRACTLLVHDGGAEAKEYFDAAWQIIKSS